MFGEALRHVDTVELPCGVVLQDLATEHLTTFRKLSPLVDRLGHEGPQQGDRHMAITLKPGARLFSAGCTTETIAVKAPPSRRLRRAMERPTG